MVEWGGLRQLGRIRRIVPPGGWRVIPGAQKGLWGCARWLWWEAFLCDCFRLSRQNQVYGDCFWLSAIY